MGNGRKKGGIGFDEQPFSWQACSSDLEIFCVLESHNARNADVEPKSQNFIGEIPAGCEAMDDAFIRSLPHFLRQYLRRISLGVARMHRSEEHTSELQSLMRSSYAVFCFKKKTYPAHQPTN